MDHRTNEAMAVLTNDEHIAYAYPWHAAKESLGGMQWVG